MDSTGVSDYYIELRGFHVTLRNTLKNAIKSLRWATRYYKTGVHLPLYSYSTPATPGWPVCSLKIPDMFLFLSLFTCYSIYLLPGIAWLGFSPPKGIYSNVTSEWPSWTILFNISPCTLTHTHPIPLLCSVHLSIAHISSTTITKYIPYLFLLYLYKLHGIWNFCLLCSLL